MPGTAIRAGPLLDLRRTVEVWASDITYVPLAGSNPVSPADLTATIYHCLGIDPHMEIHDQVNKPMRPSEGKPIEALI